MNKLITFLLLLLLIVLQYRLWFGRHSIPDYLHMKTELEAQQLHNQNLTQRNSLLMADIQDLKIGLESIEERARHELGLIKPGETFYRILPTE